MMENMAMGPLWGVIAITTLGGILTAACFAMMFYWMFRPGEKDPSHPKYQILRHDR